MKTKEWFEMWLSVYVKRQVKPHAYTALAITVSPIAQFVHDTHQIVTFAI